MSFNPVEYAIGITIERVQTFGIKLCGHGEWSKSRYVQRELECDEYLQAVVATGKARIVLGPYGEPYLIGV